MRCAVILPALLLAACATNDPSPPVKPIKDPCPPSAAAEVEPRPASVTLTEAQQFAFDAAGLHALGDALFPAYALSEAQQKARAARLEQRVEQTRQWCASRIDPG